MARNMSQSIVRLLSDAILINSSMIFFSITGGTGEGEVFSPSAETAPSSGLVE